MKHRTKLVIFWFAAVVASVSLGAGIAHADSGSGKLTDKEKNAKTWTPKIKAKLVSIYKKDGAISHHVDPECIVDAMANTWPSPRAFTKVKNSERTKRTITGIAVECYQ